MNIVEETKCRVCGGEFKEVLDLGEIYPSAFLKENEQAAEKAPLCLVQCQECELVQLKHTIDLDLMYRQYWYSSSLNKSMVNSLADIVNEIKNRGVLKPGDDIIDIGCNDGTMLSMYDNGNHLYFKTGFDPALNLQRDEKAMDFFCNDYFTFDNWPTVRNFTHVIHERGESMIKAKVITAIAMLYDLPDPNKFLKDVKRILHEDGIFVVQFTDLLSMIKLTAFDNICHEHLEYYSLRNIYALFKYHDLEVIDVSYNDVNGGSIRVTAAHEGRYLTDPNVMVAIMEETEFLLNNSIQKFAERIKTIKFKVAEFLEWCKFHNHVMYLMGASTKGNTLLQYCGITSKDIPYAAEVNKEKFGLRTAGSDIKIIPEEEALIKHPTFFFVPIWHFKKSLVKNPRILDYMSSGGKLVFPLPEFHVTYLDYEKNVKDVKI